ncbi:MAG TPA: hypothetical protein PL126_00965 [Candidatus Cloacimonadota bacterium]|nr:hypothetical protein [Candidatus Cloacimonadota bacterium]
MKLHTDVTTLSKLYPLFKGAGIEGMLTGDVSQIKGYGYPELFGALLKTGAIAEVCALITGSEVYMPEEEGIDPKKWEDCSREEVMAVILAFFFSMIGLPDESQILMAALQKHQKETSS